MCVYVALSWKREKEVEIIDIYVRYLWVEVGSCAHILYFPAIPWYFDISLAICLAKGLVI